MKRIDAAVKQDLQYMNSVARYGKTLGQFEEYRNFQNSLELVDVITASLLSDHSVMTPKHVELLNTKVQEFNPLFEAIRDEKLNRRMNKLAKTPYKSQSELQEYYRNNPVVIYRPRF
jgi:hypothetical protein